jgi:hypothetical protein
LRNVDRVYSALVSLRKSTLLFALALAAAAVSACGSSGSLKITKIAASTQKPGNIALFLDVREKGRPVANLEEKNFRVFEDGKLVPEKKAKRALLEPDVLSVHFTYVLVDLSGPIADSEYLAELAATVGKFSQNLAENHTIAVSAFDGNDEVAPFLGFGAGPEQLKKLADGLAKFRPRNRSSNLYGAVYQGLHTLEEQLNNSPLPDKAASLIVFTDRTDISHTVGVEQLREKVKNTPAQVFVIGVGEKISRPDLTAIGKTGLFLSNDPRDYKKGFDEISQKLVTVAEGRYVLSFCSTKKKGSHKLEVEVVAPNDTGKVTHKFNASGFRPNSCSPKIKPLFEEVEALKAEVAEKDKEIKERVAQEEAKEAEKLQQGLLGAPKETGKESPKEAAKEPSRDVGKETVKAASVKEPAKPAPPPPSAPSKQATDNE